MGHFCTYFQHTTHSISHELCMFFCGYSISSGFMGCLYPYNSGVFHLCWSVLYTFHLGNFIVTWFSAKIKYSPMGWVVCKMHHRNSKSSYIDLERLLLMSDWTAYDSFPWQPSFVQFLFSTNLLLSQWRENYDIHGNKKKWLSLLNSWKTCCVMWCAC